MQRRAPRSPIIQSDVIILGVDIAKDQSVAVAQDGAGGVSKPLEFAMSQLGFEALWAFARRAAKSAGAASFVVALEPTGHYGAPLVEWLQERDVEVMRVEPLDTNRGKQLYDGTRRKTDAKDAGVIAMLCRQGACRPYERPEELYAHLRVFSRRREQLVKQRSQTVNRLHRHLDETFPELARLFRRQVTPTLLALLEVASSPAGVLALSIEELAAVLRAASRGQLGVERAKALHAAAERSIGSRCAAEAHRLALVQLVGDLRHLMAQLAAVEREMRTWLCKVPYAGRLLSIPRLGAITVATLLGEFGDLRRYDRASKLIKHAGLDLVESSSGKRKGQRHISRRGRAYARQMLYLAALRIGVGHFAAARERLVERGKGPLVAAVANMCRMLRVMHAVVRDDVPFDAAHGMAADEVSMAA